MGTRTGNPTWADAPATTSPLSAGALNNIETAIDASAPIDSPTFTGTPAGPTATPGTNTTQFATTAFVTAAVAAGQSTPADATTTTKGVIQLAGHLYNTASAPFVRGATESQTGIVELATAAETTTGTDSTRAVHPAGLKVELDKKANLASPTFTGVPAAPTATAGTNTTQLATTAFVTTAVAAVSGGSVADATTTTKGIVQLAGDLDGTAAAPTVVSASTTVAGKVELATTAETTTGTDTARAVTPAGVKAVADTKAALVHGHALTDANITGVLPIAQVPTGTTSTTVALGNHTHTSASVTDFSSAALAAVPSASETVQGKVELATTAEASAGTDTARAVTPAGLKAVADTKANTTHGHALTDANITGVLPIAQIPTGTTGTTVALGNHTHTPSAIGAIPSFADPNADRIVFWDDSAGAYAPLTVGTGLTITGTTLDATGGGSVPDASETVKGVVELATTAETTTGTDTLRAVTPAGVKAVADTKSDVGHTHTAASIGAIPAFADPNADRIVFWDDSASAFVALQPSSPLGINNTSLQISAASESAVGAVERATTAETQAMTDTTRYISPANLASAASTTPVANRIARYSASAIIQSSEPVAAADVATKNYVDTRPSFNKAPTTNAAYDFKLDRIAEFVGPVGTRLTIPTHVTPAGGQATHPSIVFSADRWNGYHYWMGITPYPGSNDDHEDPNLVVSNDGITWIQAPGVTQPLDDADGTPEYNSDVELAFGPDSTLYVFWRLYDTGSTGTEEKIYVRTSQDGVNFTAKQLVWQSNHTVNRYLSPAFMWEDNRWKMWAVDIVPANHTVIFRQATVGVKVPTISDWSSETVCSLTGQQAGKEPWHLGVTKIGSTYVMLLNDTVTGSAQVDNDLVLFTSGNGTTWSGAGAPCIPRVQAGEHDRLYRATMIPEMRNGVMGLRVWYSAWIPGSPDVWNIYRTFVGIGIGSGVVRTGSESIPSLVANTGGTTINVTYPLPFDRNPVVVAYTNSGRSHLAMLSQDRFGFSVRIENYTSAAVNGAFMTWTAFTP
jgi:hypothetical protein